MPRAVRVGMFACYCCLEDAFRIDVADIEWVKEELESDECCIYVYDTLEELIDNTTGCGTTIDDRPDLKQYLKLS